MAKGLAFHYYNTKGPNKFRENGREIPTQNQPNVGEKDQFGNTKKTKKKNCFGQ